MNVFWMLVFELELFVIPGPVGRLLVTMGTAPLAALASFVVVDGPTVTV